MKTKLLALAFILPVGLFYSCGESETADESTEETVITEETIQEPVEEEVTQIVKDVEAEEFKSLIESGKGQILDVRTPGEFDGGHIANAQNVDFNGADFEASIDALDKTQPYYVYCQGGGRSGQAKNMMAEKGFSEVYNLIGGYGNWPYKE